MKPSLEQKLPAMLAEARDRAGLSQQEVGEQVGCHQTAISHWESGRGARALARALRLAAVLKLRLTDFA